MKFRLTKIEGKSHSIPLNAVIEGWTQDNTLRPVIGEPFYVRGNLNTSWDGTYTWFSTTEVTHLSKGDSGTFIFHTKNSVWKLEHLICNG